MRLCVPTVSEDVVNDAVPPNIGTLARTVVPCLKLITSPSGGVPPDEVTVAVSLTACPIYEGFTDEATVVVVASFATTDSLSAGEALPVSFVSPAYCAVMERVPAVANEVVRLA